MNTKLPQDLIEQLVAIGASGQVDEAADVFSPVPSAHSGAFMRLAPAAWYEVAALLDDSQLIACVKALTVLERLPNFRAGSVSPVIWLFRVLEERSVDDLTVVVDWVLSHTANPYLPFGSNNYGARSLAELGALSARAGERALERRQAEASRHREARARRAASASHKLFGAIRRRDKKGVLALLAKGADINGVNEEGQTALEYARSLGVQHLLDLKPERSG